jgi:hypothetical protein
MASSRANFSNVASELRADVARACVRECVRATRGIPSDTMSLLKRRRFGGSALNNGAHANFADVSGTYESGINSYELLVNRGDVSRLGDYLRTLWASGSAS